ncbi:hypothetical protein HNP33_001064 [Comamonas odontotermitis]|uniref:Uncharacterized protein n=1 Tax=Comamonas odontotermitis TaxID=379895 RepID=A0ABR6RDB2_9BURK|nr:hypothetical protein [Comamonas odontotermitis]MBB6577014.1 hypothetical protein [Comamonas odontotermitis]
MSKRKNNYLPDVSAFPVGVPTEVIDAVRALYEACATRRAVWPLNACISCCMDAKMAREMCDGDLRSLTARHIYEYQDAAHAAEQDADEYLHFLPKVAELISQGDTDIVRHSTEIALQRLGGFDHSMLSFAEKQAIERWALALWQWWLDAAGNSQGRFSLMHESADSLLVMFANAGLTIEPFLALWQRSESAWAAVQFGTMLAHMVPNGSGITPFAKDTPQLEPSIRTWAFKTEVYMHFAAIWAQLTDSDALGLCNGHLAMEASVCATLGPRVSALD